MMWTAVNKVLLIRVHSNKVHSHICNLHRNIQQNHIQSSFSSRSNFLSPSHNHDHTPLPTSHSPFLAWNFIEYISNIVLIVMCWLYFGRFAYNMANAIRCSITTNVLRCIALWLSRWRICQSCWPTDAYQDSTDRPVGQTCTSTYTALGHCPSTNQHSNRFPYF